MSDQSEAVEGQAVQRTQAKRATLSNLLDKKPREQVYEFKLDPDGDPVSLSMRAIGAADYDKLVTKYPPQPEQRVEGAAFNINTFGPALLARVVVEPVADENEWKQVWASQAWSVGEVREIFFAAANLCGQGLNLDPIAAG